MAGMDPQFVKMIQETNERISQYQGPQVGPPVWVKSLWYHGRIDRATADTILAGKRPGLYLVRDSSTCPGDYVLSVSENNKVSHYIISRRGGLYLIGDQTFTDLPAVIEFYKMHFLDTTTLTQHADRPGSQGPAPGAPHPPPTGGDFPDVGKQLPPPIPVVGKLVVRGRFEFKSDDPEDLNFKKGDVMTVVRKDEDDWWFAKHEDGREGSIPVPYVEIVEDHSLPFYARATMDRECPYDPTALSFKTGDVIKVTKQNENGVWEGELSGRKGHFPFNLVEVVDSSNHQ